MSRSERPGPAGPQAGRTAGPPAAADPRISPEDLIGLVASAARAPSLHNSQPWRFRLRENAIELYSDPERMIPLVDPDGREMLISCGAALYGLRLGLRRLGYLPVTELVPDAARPGEAPGLLARIRPGALAQPSRDELGLISALPHRHTHRGPFGPGRVPQRLLAALVEDAAAEGAELILLSSPQATQLAELTETARRQQAASPPAQMEERSWARPPGSTSRDGVPARARPSADPVSPLRKWLREEPAHQRLAPRDFGSPSVPTANGPLPSATAVLATAGDTPADWLRAGQALHRLLLRAATRWVFATLHSQALESPRLRAQVQDALGLRAMPQLLLQFGRANTAAATPRRPVTDVIDTIRPAPGP